MDDLWWRYHCLFKWIDLCCELGNGDQWIQAKQPSGRWRSHRTCRNARCEIYWWSGSLLRCSRRSHDQDLGLCCGWWASCGPSCRQWPTQWSQAEKLPGSWFLWASYWSRSQRILGSWFWLTRSSRPPRNCQNHRRPQGPRQPQCSRRSKWKWLPLDRCQSRSGLHCRICGYPWSSWRWDFARRKRCSQLCAWDRDWSHLQTRNSLLSQHGSRSLGWKWTCRSNHHGMLRNWCQPSSFSCHGTTRSSLCQQNTKRGIPLCMGNQFP